MTIYLMQGSDDQARVDEIEGKLKSRIPDLKRIPTLEGVDEISVDGVERSIVVLIAAGPEIGSVQSLIDAVSGHSRRIFFIVIGGDISARDYKRLIQSGNADWVAEAGLPHEILEIVGRVNLRRRRDQDNDGSLHAIIDISSMSSRLGPA